MSNLTRSLRVTALVSLTVLMASASWAGEINVQEPALTMEPEYFDGAYVDDSPADASFDLGASFDQGYDLGTAFSGAGTESVPDYGIGESLARLTPKGGATASKGTVLVPWTSSADLAPRGDGQPGGLAALIKAARAHYLEQGGTVDGDGVMHLDMTLDQVLTGLSWRKHVVENLQQGN